jgi:hypothetical protein
VLVPRYQAQGNWTSQTFTITGGQWNIGWAYQCTPPPASGPAFEVLTVSTASPSSPVTSVTETGASGQGVTPQTTSGSQQIQVQAPAGCTWVVQVTGIGTP